LANNPGVGQNSIDFKCVDNLQHSGDVMGSCQTGDVTPEGRFNYRYNGD